ncbi:PilZ domain-containing protein [Roseburia hominis]
METKGRERRSIERVQFRTNGIIVVRETEEMLYVQIEDMSPLGIGFRMEAGSPDIRDKDIVVITETAIMYADVVHVIEQQDGSIKVGVSMKKFTEDLLKVLFKRISL